MFSKHTIFQTRIASFAIAATMTFAMLMSINMLATGEAHAEQLAARSDIASCTQV